MARDTKRREEGTVLLESIARVSPSANTSIACYNNDDEAAAGYKTEGKNQRNASHKLRASPALSLWLISNVPE